MEFSNFDLLSGTEVYAEWDVKAGRKRGEVRQGRMFVIFWTLSLRRNEEWKKAHIMLLQGTHAKQISMLRIVCAMECLKWNNINRSTMRNEKHSIAWFAIPIIRATAKQSGKKTNEYDKKKYYNCFMFSYDKPREQISAFLFNRQFAFIWQTITKHAQRINGRIMPLWNR